MFNLRTNIGSY